MRRRLQYLILACVTTVALLYLALVPPLSVDNEPARSDTVALWARPTDTNPTTSSSIVTTTTTTSSSTSTTIHSEVEVAITTTSEPSPATAPPTTVIPPTDRGRCGGWRSLIEQHFPNEADRACRVFVGCESKGDPNAVSPTDDHGLTQINAPTWNRPGHADPVADWIGRNWHNVYDPGTNLAMAAKIRAKYGWSMWRCK